MTTAGTLAWSKEAPNVVWSPPSPRCRRARVVGAATGARSAYPSHLKEFTPKSSSADTQRVRKLRVVSEAPAQANSPWEEWGRLTRFLESARLAFARERNLWASLGIDEQVRISAADGGYNVAVHKHIDAIDDEETLYGSVLVHSYALAESAVATRLAIDPRSLGGIEDWGTRLLSTNDRDWSEVAGGLAGAVEVAVVRNAFAHGSRTIDPSARARLLTAGARTRPAGSMVTLPYAQLREFRERLRSLLNVAGI